MSQNLIEKLQEIWGDIRQDYTVRKIRKNWKKMKKTEGYIVASAIAKTAASGLQRSGGKLLNNIKYGIIGAASLISGPTSGATGGVPRPAENDGSADTYKETRLTPVMKQLQEVHSDESLQKICSQLLSNDTVYNKICAEKSEQLGEEILRVAGEVQDLIGGNRGQIRSRILKNRWGKDVPVGLHCLRSALEVTTEAAENTKSPEFINAFVKKIRDYNPNGYYGLHDTFCKHRNYKKSTRNHKLTQIIAEETKDNPYDICLIAHKSKGNHTGSGYHMVLYYNHMIISFNNEKIEDADEYFKDVENQGDLINISRTVREDGREEITQNIIRQFVDDIRAGNTETIETVLASYMGNKEVPLQDRIIAGSVLQSHLPIAGNLPATAMNIEHLRIVRAKMPKPAEVSEKSERPAPRKKIGNRNPANQFAAATRQRQNRNTHI